jgi:hypothetical protein
MSEFTVECYADQGNDGNFEVVGTFLGKVSIATLSATSQSVALPVGTKLIRVASDASVTVYFLTGDSAVSATVAGGKELRAGQGEGWRVIGVKRGHTYIAARVA